MFLHILHIVLGCFLIQSSFALNIKKWHFLGPFTVGKNELDGNPAFNIDDHYQTYRNTKKRHTDLISELVTGGTVSWQEIKTTSTHKIPIHLQGVDFNTIVQTLFSMEAQEVQGWVVGQIKIPVSGMYSISCLSMLTCYVDDLHRMLAGDMFQTGRIATSLHLTKGKHVVYGHLKFVGRTAVEVKISKIHSTKSTKHIVVHPPAFLPDLIGLGQTTGTNIDPDVSSSSYYMGTGWLSIPVTNRGNAGYRIKFQVKQLPQHKALGLRVVPSSSSSYLIYSGQYTTVPVQLAMAHGVPRSRSSCPLTFQLIPLVQHINQTTSGTTAAAHRTRKWVQKEPLVLQCRCRTTRQSFIFTFVDHDGSISRAAAITPLPSPSSASATAATGTSKQHDSAAGVLLSLHGTGVDVSMQADSYKFKPTKHANDDRVPYTFGVQGMWTLAPTRNGAHNWEYTGFLSALTALETLGTPGDHGQGSCILPSEIVPHFPRASINFHKVIFTGHSMGGHGAWTIATHVPDRALGVVSAAGWIRKEYYGDSNRFFIHDIGHSFIDSSLKGILENTFVEYNADVHGSNLKGLMVHARIGANDRSVPPYQVRKMVRVLLEHGVNTTYEEIPNKEHWWWDTLRSNDGGVLNDVKLRKIYRAMKRRTREGHESGSECFVDRFTLVAMHPGSVESKCGMRILQIWKPLSMSKLTVRWSSDVWHIQTQNVRRISVNGRYLCASVPCRSSVTIDQVEQVPITLSQMKQNKMVEFCQYDDQQVVAEIVVVPTGTRNDVRPPPPPPPPPPRRWRRCAHSDPIQHPLVTNTSYSFEQYERGPTNSGPARQLFASPFVIVTTFHSLPSYLSLYTANMHMAAASTSVEILHDTVYVSTKDQQHKNMFVVGRHNLLFHRQQASRRRQRSSLVANPPVDTIQDSNGQLIGFQVGPCQFIEPGIGILYTAPLWDQKYHRSRVHVYMVGTDDDGLRAIASLLQPTIPPMLRAPLSNQMPDFMVVSSKVLGQGAGGILAAGSWGYDWNWSEESSYWQC